LKTVIRYSLLLLSALLVFFSAVPAMRAGTAALPFDDIADSYARDQIIELYNARLIEGVGQRKFAPEADVTRAEFVTMLLRARNLNPVNNALAPFDDVPPSSWEYGWVNAAVDLGWTEGTGPQTFAPGRPISRQEAAAVLARALKQAANPAAVTSLPFKDQAEIAPWAVSPVRSVWAAGLIEGDDQSRFRPSDSLTRQETAVILHRMIQGSGKRAPAVVSPAAISLGWLYNASASDWQNAVRQPVINTLSPRWFFLQAGGVWSNSADSSRVSYARQNGKTIWAMAGNGFNRELTHQILAQSDARATAVRQLADLADRYQLDGINIDFENLLPEDRQLFTRFTQELAVQLHTLGKVLSVCVPPNLEADWSTPFDYAALGAAADYLIVMGYDEHWSGDPEAGSVSSLPWLEGHVKKLASRVPPQKIIAALPLYSRLWSLQPDGAVSRDLTLREQNRIVGDLLQRKEWNSAAGQYVVAYTDSGTPVRIWAEDARSLSLKYRTIRAYGISGFAYWYLGSESPDIWTALDNERNDLSASLGAIRK
jgi:spore germination protein YaaH